jgi:hypothetical protein
MANVAKCKLDMFADLLQEGFGPFRATKSLQGRRHDVFEIRGFTDTSLLSFLDVSFFTLICFLSLSRRVDK